MKSKTPQELPPQKPPVNDATRFVKSSGERQRGAVGWVFLWLIGIPIPILLLLFFVRGCT